MMRARVAKGPVAGVEAKKIGGKLHIQGFASIFNVTDLQGDIMRPGAFRKTITESVGARKVALMSRHILHGGDASEAVGTLISGEEKPKGFWFDSELFDDQASKDIHAKIEASPELFGASVSGEWVDTTPIVDDAGDVTGLDIKEAKLLEVTITMMPAVQETKGTLEAKAEQQRLDQIEGRLAALESKAGVEAVGTGTKGAPDKAAPKAARRDYTDDAARRQRLISIAEGELE